MERGAIIGMPRPRVFIDKQYGQVKLIASL